MLNRTMLNKSTRHNGIGGLHCEKCRLVLRRFAGCEHVSRHSQGFLNSHCERKVVTMLEDAERTARRVLGGTHPLTSQIEQHLPNAQDTLRERETSSGMATRTRAARARPTEED